MCDLPNGKKEYEHLVIASTTVKSINVNRPINTAIHGSHPNPFNPIATIEYSLSEDYLIELSIHNMKGEKVENLYSGYKNSGAHQIMWEAKSYPSGMYFFTLSYSSEIHTHKRLLLK